MRILIAEDSELNFEMLAECIGIGEHELCWARDGEQAIDEIGAGEFDLLLLDLHMPKVDGFAVLKWLQDQERVDMKVIVLTADDAVHEDTMALGADAFLTKPLDLRQLSAAIKVVTGVAAGCGGPQEPDS